MTTMTPVPETDISAQKQVAAHTFAEAQRKARELYAKWHELKAKEEAALKVVNNGRRSDGRKADADELAAAGKLLDELRPQVKQTEREYVNAEEAESAAEKEYSRLHQLAQAQ